MTASVLLPALAVFCVLSGLRARVDVYDAFVRGAREGLLTLWHMAPYLAVILMAVALVRETGLLADAQRALAPVMGALGLPPQAAGVVLQRPLSGSASLAAVKDVLDTCGAESRAARLCCVISGASETVFFTGSLYLGAAGVKKARYAVPVALAAYLAGVLAAAHLV